MTDTITITGNVATDPERKRTPAGLTITTFRVASSQRRRDPATGEWVDSGTNYYTVSTYRRLADHAFDSLRKGERVLLTGRLRLRPWESGEKRGVAIEIDADAIGHDLLWGTTTYTKDERTPRAEQHGDSWTPGVAGGGWGAPGVDLTVAQGSDSRDSPDPADAEATDSALDALGALLREGIVGTGDIDESAAGAQTRERADAETPF